MARVRVPAAGNSSARRLPKPKRKKRSKGSKGSGIALVGVAASLAAAWLFAAFRIGRRKREEAGLTKTLLQSMVSKPMLLTEHGACRMDCRHIPKTEVFEVLQRGQINSRKSNPKEEPCPKYVVDAKVGKPGKNVEAVFSACRDATKLITVIDKDFDWECYCP